MSVKAVISQDKGEPLVMIIVLNWNGKQDTLDCLRSLKLLDYANRQVLVVDNASTDGSVKAIRSFDPTLKIIENTHNLGYAEGNNVGVRYALREGAQYILILNNDTVVRKDTVSTLINTMLQNSNIGVVCPRIYYHSDPDKLWFGGAYWIPEKARFEHLNSTLEEMEKSGQGAYRTDYASGCALLFGREIPRQIGLFDPRFFLMWEETDWCYRARTQGFDVMVEPSAKIWHKVASSFDGGSHGPQAEYYLTRNRLLWIEKNLEGKEKFRAYLRVFRELYWAFRKLQTQTLLEKEAQVQKARLIGGQHYLRRRFGQVHLHSSGLGSD